MILWHATPLWRVSSILEYGLLTRCCRDGTGRIWLHAAEVQPWARDHVAKRHGCEAGDVALLTVNVPAAMVVRSGRGLFVVSQDIDPAWVQMVRFRSLRQPVLSK